MRARRAAAGARPRAMPSPGPSACRVEEAALAALDILTRTCSARSRRSPSSRASTRSARARRRRRRGGLQRRRHRPAARLPRDPVSGDRRRAQRLGRASSRTSSSAMRASAMSAAMPPTRRRLPTSSPNSRRAPPASWRGRQARRAPRSTTGSRPAIRSRPGRSKCRSSGRPRTEVDMARLAEDFHAAHQVALCGRRSCLAGRVHRLARPRQQQSRPGGRMPACAPPRGARPSRAGGRIWLNRWTEVDVHRFAAIPAEARRPGPAIVEVAAHHHLPPAGEPRPPAAVGHPRGDRMSDACHPRDAARPADRRRCAWRSWPTGWRRSRARWRIPSTAPVAPASSTRRATSPAASSPPPRAAHRSREPAVARPRRTEPDVALDGRHAIPCSGAATPSCTTRPITAIPTPPTTPSWFRSSTRPAFTASPSSPRRIRPTSATRSRPPTPALPATFTRRAP